MAIVEDEMYLLGLQLTLYLLCLPHIYTRCRKVAVESLRGNSILNDLAVILYLWDYLLDLIAFDLYNQGDLVLWFFLEQRNRGYYLLFVFGDEERSVDISHKVAEKDLDQ